MEQLFPTGEMVLEFYVEVGLEHGLEHGLEYGLEMLEGLSNLEGYAFWDGWGSWFCWVLADQLDGLFWVLNVQEFFSCVLGLKD